MRRGAWALTQLVVRLAVVLVITASLANAQLPTGSIAGRILDSSGAVLPGGSITVTSQETGRVQTTRSAEDGYYKLVLPVGVYQIKVELPGFRPEERQNLQLAVAEEAVQNFTLQVGAQEELVSVTADNPLVDTSSANLGGLVTEQRISDLPLNGRNFNELVLLQPGVTVLNQVSTSNSASVGLSFSANGSPIRSNYQVIDGASITDSRDQNGVSASGSMLGVEGIREFRTITNAFSAEYGMTMGAQMTAVSKGGTNQYHGSAFEFLRNSALDARNFFDGPQIPAFRRNNFGGSFGGPIRKNKLFFFLTYEGVRSSQGISEILNTPNQQARQDGFLVPRVAPAVKPYLALFPLPTQPLPTDPSGTSGIGQFKYVFKQPVQEDFGQGRADYNISRHDNVFVRTTIVDTIQVTPNNFPGYVISKVGNGRYTTVAEDHTFSPTVLNTFRSSYSSSDGPTTIGFDPRSLDPSLGFAPGQQMGAITITGVTSISDRRPSAGSFYKRIWTFSDDVFWSRGAHSFKFGTLINRFRPGGFNPGSQLGTYTFSSLSSFLLAQPQSLQINNLGGVPAVAYGYSSFGFYVQDDWHVSRTLALNLGLRYEILDTVNELTGHGGGVRDLLHDTAPTLGPQAFRNSSLRNFGPRLGFAWDVFGNASTSVRGGFGLLYDVGNFTRALLTSYPNAPQFGGQSTITTNLTFPLTPFGPGIGSTPNDISAFDYNLQQPHMLQYNLTVERQFPGSLMLGVSYVGSRGYNLLQNAEGNPTQPSGQVNGRDFYPLNAPRLNPHWGSIALNTAKGDSWYNSFQVNLQKQLSHGLQFQSSYTWSKLLDTTQGQDNGDSAGSATVGLDPLHPGYDKGRADFDIPQSWRFNLLYAVPSLRFARPVLGGWRLGSIFSVTSGVPFTVSLSGNRSRSLVSAGKALDRADVVPDRTTDIILGGPNRYFDPLAFTIQPVGFLGNSGRNILRGPASQTWNLSLAKDIPVPLAGEQSHFEFRTEVFNALNRANFYAPVTNAGGAVVYSADATRTVATPLATAGVITRTVTNARQIQFALKFIF